MVKKISLVSLFLCASAMNALAQTTPDPEAAATTAITSATTIMESLQVLVIAGVVFGLIISFLKKRGRA